MRFCGINRLYFPYGPAIWLGHYSLTLWGCQAKSNHMSETSGMWKIYARTTISGGVWEGQGRSSYSGVCPRSLRCIERPRPAPRASFTQALLAAGTPRVPRDTIAEWSENKNRFLLFPLRVWRNWCNRYIHICPKCYRSVYRRHIFPLYYRFLTFGFLVVLQNDCTIYGELRKIRQINTIVKRMQPCSFSSYVV